jgi:hypothetical protein
MSQRSNDDRLSTDDQLKGITIIVDSVDYDDDGQPYAITNIFRGDLEGSIDKFVKHVTKSKQVVEFNSMKAGDD